MRPRDLALILAINLVWAFNVVAVKLSVTGVTPLAAAFLRYVVVLAVCLRWLRWVPNQMPRVLGAALAQGALWIGLLNLAFARAHDVAALSFVSQLGAVFSLLLAVIFLGERVHLIRSIAMAVAVAGVAVIGFDGRVLGEGAALWFAVLSAFLYSCGAILLRGLNAVSPFTLFAWIGLTAAPLLGLASWWVEPGGIAAAIAQPPLKLWPIVYSALASSLIGHAGFAYLVQRYPVSTVTPLLLPSPLLGALMAVAVLGDPVTARLAVGGALILAGVAVISLRTKPAP
ncbi:MAG: DMT family transporter [Sphingomonadaceae bacterium]|nr:DMT family transporter [Sphingomonadaceae bacterium]